jgi:hypothetical protein
MQVLMDRNNEGLLGQDEKDELESLVEVSENMSLLRAKALRMDGTRNDLVRRLQGPGS